MNKINNTLTLFEYEKSTESLDKKQIEIIEKNYLKQFSILSNNKIEAKQFVGIYQVKNKTIEVIPKIFSNKENDKKENIKGILYMLSITKKLKINETEISKLCEKENSLFEIFIYLFSKNLLELLIKDFKKNYVKREENLNFIKEKLNFIKNIKFNFVNKAKFYCEFEEFEENILMNQIFKYCVKHLLKFTKSKENFNLLRKCDFIMGEVNNIKFKNSKICDNVKFTRLNFEYETTFNLAKLLLFGNSPNLENDNFKTFSIMFDMNKLFEEFIFEILKENKKNLNIKEIKKEKENYIFNKSNEKNKNLFKMKPDIYIKFEDERELIIDTKYKKINTIKKSSNDNDKNKFGVSQNDIYQIFTYSKYFKSYKNILLYPKYEIDFNESLENEKQNFNLKILTIDLKLKDNEDLKKYKNRINFFLK